MTPDALALATVDLAVRNNDPEALDRIAAILDAEDQVAPSLSWEAQNYALAGISVFPLKPGQKVPATRHGFKDATTDVDQVREWWSDNPAYNIGFATGHLFDVIDVDGPPGYRSLVELEDSGAIPPVLAKVSTARGGRHYYVKPSGDGNAAGVWPGIDYRGRGGYVVAPPSLSATTGYRWTWIEAWTS